MTAIIPTNYQGQAISFNEDGWFNATEAAARFGKRVDHFLANEETKEYITVLFEVDSVLDNTRNPGDYKMGLSHFVKTKRGKNGGTWFHPDLAVFFARWLDARFAIWCDRQIKDILAGTHPFHNWKRERSMSTSSNKVMSELLKTSREDLGKETAVHHYINENRLVNSILSGRYAALDREELSLHELSCLAKLEIYNATLLGRGLDYQTRKQMLRDYAEEKIPFYACIEKPRRIKQRRPSLSC